MRLHLNLRSLLKCSLGSKRLPGAEHSRPVKRRAVDALPSATVWGDFRFPKRWSALGEWWSGITARTGARPRSRGLVLEQLEDRMVPSTVMGDFNGDGFKDLAVGNPNATVAGVSGAGKITIIYGDATGLNGTTQVITKSDLQSASGTNTNDRFGWALAVGDYDGDGKDDLVVGDPYDNVGRINDAGTINVIYGSAAGLTTAGNRLFYQGFGLQHRAGAGDLFGYAVAAGDFNHDGNADLVVGVPHNRIHLPDGTTINAGGIMMVIYGSNRGLVSSGNQAFSMFAQGAVDDAFGSALASGDFNGDGFADVAVGIPGRDDGASDGGAVKIFFGAAAGVRSSGTQYFRQGAAGIQGAAQDGARFGSTLVAGNFNGDGFADLAIGAPLEDVNGVVDAGAVAILYGSATKLTATGNQLWSQDTLNNGGALETGAHFGGALAVADLDGDGRADLAIGVPEKTVGSLNNAGAIDVVYGASAGLSAAGSQFWTQDAVNDGQAGSSSDHFGAALAGGDVNGDGFGDLAIEVPGASPTAQAVNVMYGSALRLGSSGNQYRSIG